MQDESEWVEISGYKDVAIYTEVAFVNDQALFTELRVQTSPSKHEALFAASQNPVSPTPYIARYLFSSTPPLGVQPIQIVRTATANLSGTPSRWLRWQVIFPAAETTLTFRMWLNLNRSSRP